MGDLSEIINLCKKEKREAQASLYTMLAPRLLGIALRYMQDRDEAEDVLQESFIKIFSSIKKFKGEGSFEGWAKRITVNTALDALKKKNKIRFERNLSIVQNIEFAEEEVSQISMDEIILCMDTLPAGYRTIVNLFLVEEFSHREIAEQLGIQESTSRSQYTRARQALLKTLKERMAQLSAKNA